jgi:hypothetical protein
MVEYEMAGKRHKKRKKISGFVISMGYNDFLAGIRHPVSSIFDTRGLLSLQLPDSMAKL